MSDQETDTNEQLEEEEEQHESDEDQDQDDDDASSEPADPPKPLTSAIIADCLTLLCKSSNGLSHAYVKLDVKERELTDIKVLDRFIHLRYVDITKNLIRHITPLNSLTNLLLLRADMNKLQHVNLEPLPYLQVASFTGNHLKSTEGLNHPLVENLNLGYNQITAISGLDPTILTRLHTLELRGNQLESTDGINLPNLKNLFMGANLINKIEGLERLENLTTLHLRDNQLKTLDGFSDSMKNLQYINLRGNFISSSDEIAKLSVLPQLRALVIAENPICDEDDYRLEVLVSLRNLERLDKDELTEEERQEAQDTYAQRREQQLEEAQQATAAEDPEEED